MSEWSSFRSEIIHVFSTTISSSFLLISSICTSSLLVIYRSIVNTNHQLNPRYQTINPIRHPQKNQVTFDTISSLNFFVFVLRDPICHDYASGTYLPVGSTIDEFIICGENGQSTRKKCKPGFHYNALTTNCEMSIYKMIGDFIFTFFL